MWSARKYTPLPTTSDGGPQRRKRAGGGLSTWKRWVLLGGAVLVVLGVGYTGLGRRGLIYVDEVGYEEQSEWLWSI